MKFVTVRFDDKIHHNLVKAWIRPGLFTIVVAIGKSKWLGKERALSVRCNPQLRMCVPPGICERWWGFLNRYVRPGTKVCITEFPGLSFEVIDTNNNLIAKFASYKHAVEFCTLNRLDKI